MKEGFFMPEQTQAKIPVFIISDSLGETGFNLVQAAMVQFPTSKFTIKRFPLTRTTSLLDGILKQAKRENAFVVYSLVVDKLADYVAQFCYENQLQSYDIISDLIDKFSKRTATQPLHQAGMNHNTDKEYFNRIEAIEFAVTYDDGKDPAGFLKADIVLLGVSRTSKTPLSLYLANRGYKVANLPLVPKTQIPKELYQVDPKKIFGLTNDVAVLNDIRKSRMIAYGLNPDTVYSNVDNIKAELQFANDLYKQLGCLSINVAHKSIEETATLIVESLQEDEEE